MQSFTFEFKTSADGKAQAFHFNIHNKNTQADARDSLVSQLEDIVEQAKALKASSEPSPASVASNEAAAGEEEQSGDPSTSDEVNTLPEVKATMSKKDIEAIAETEKVDISAAKNREEMVAAITAAREAGAEALQSASGAADGE